MTKQRLEELRQPGQPSIEMMAEALAEIDRLRGFLKILSKRLSCGKHRPLRHPLCGDCQAIAMTEQGLQ